MYALLGDISYNLQATAKTVEGAQDPDRNRQVFGLLMVDLWLNRYAT